MNLILQKLNNLGVLRLAASEDMLREACREGAKEIKRLQRELAEANEQRGTLLASGSTLTGIKPSPLGEQIVRLERERDELQRHLSQAQELIREYQADKYHEIHSASPEPCAKPQENDGHDYRSGVFANCGYTGTASGYIVRDGTWWVATFRNENEADQYVAMRNTPPPPTDEVAAAAARVANEIGLDDEQDPFKDDLRMLIASVRASQPPQANQEEVERLRHYLRRVREVSRANGDTQAAALCTAALLPVSAYEALQRSLHSADSHRENEWADMAANGIQWIRNIRNGISTPLEALTEMEANLRRIMNLPRQERVSTTAQIHQEEWVAKEDYFRVAEAYERLREALLTLLPGLVLDLRYASDDDDKEAMRARIKTVKEALKITPEVNSSKERSDERR